MPRRCLRPQDEARFETVTYTYYEQLNGYEYLKSLDIGYFFYTRPLSRRDHEGARPVAEDDRAYPERELARKHEGQAQGSRGDHGRARHWKGVDPVDWLPPDRAAGRHGRVIKVADLVDDSDPAKRDQGAGGAERPGAAQQPRPCGHHHRARHGQGRLRLDLVRARADGRLSQQPDRDHSDHRPRHPRRAGQGDEPASPT